jgi:hypothetical protein
MIFFFFLSFLGHTTAGPRQVTGPVWVPASDSTAATGYVRGGEKRKDPGCGMKCVDGAVTDAVGRSDRATERQGRGPGTWQGGTEKP